MDMHRKRRGFLLLALIASLLSGSIAYRYFREGISVDECLDVKHGSFDYSRTSCDPTRNHPYIPYKLRHPYDETIALIATFVVMTFGFAIVLTKNARKTI
jgi:hypothetical protein